MVWARRIWLRLQTLFRRNRDAKQLDDEIQFHLEKQISENIAAGMSREEARYAAMRAFGNPTFLKEQTRDTWGWTWLEQIGQDLRYGLRQLGRSPGFTLAVVLSLALGIGANTAIFSLVDAVLLKMLPVKNPESLVLLNWVFQKRPAAMIAETIVQERLFAQLSSFFGALAVLLACIGLYGLMGYIVSRQTAKIGIRRALGAERLDIFRLVMRKVLVMVILGVCIGVPASLAATRLISSYLFGLKATDPLTIVLCSLLMLVVAALAGYFPARRAAKVDPLVALRYE